MRILSLMLVLGVSASALSAAPTGDVWRPPVPTPAGCPSPTFEVLLIDVSRSMRRDGLFERVRDSVEKYLSGAAPPCSLAVLATFGTTADIQDGQFLASPSSRERLVLALRKIRPVHEFTNLDEAAKLIELLTYQLRAAYGLPANRLVVRVYSDNESSPSAGKPAFSLGRFLARRLDARYVGVSAGSVPTEQTLRVESRTEHANNRPGPSAESYAHSKLVIAAGVIGGVVLLVVVAWAFLLRSPRRVKVPRAGGLGALLVTETAVADGTAVPSFVGSEHRVDVAEGVPAVFSTDANRATYIAAMLPGASNGELFRIEPLPDGSIRIQSPHPRLTVDGEPLNADRRLKVNIREPIRIGLGPREFNIVGVFGRPATLRPDGIFDAGALQQ